MDERVQAQQKPSVLIVEDEPAIAELFKTLLQMEGFKPHVASSNSSALEYLEDRVPDVVILDVMMPGETGLDLCRYIRQTPQLEDLPVIVVSARTQADDVNAGMEAGADVYLQKPVSNKALVDTVRRSIRRRSTTPPAPPPAESLELEVKKTLIEVRRYIAEIDRAERAYKDFVDGLERRTDLTLADKQAKSRQAAEMYRQQIKLNQSAGWEVFEKVLEKLEMREFSIRRRSRHQPETAEQWQMAAARAQFVREDCESWAESRPDQILLEYQGAVASDDKVYAYLLERYGQDSLEERNDWETLSELRARISDLSYPDPVELEKIQSLYDQINPLRARLSSIRPPDALILVERPETSNGSQPPSQNGSRSGNSPQESGKRSPAMETEL
ncbi:MAG: response regulator [Anaerolineales bacterium]|nr:response regulator [Anaerolineales bacterium]